MENNTITKDGSQSASAPGRLHWVRPPGGSRFRREQGGTLVLVVMAVAILALGLGTYMQDLGSYRRIAQQRILDDQALMAAEAGLAEETGTLETMATPPTSDIATQYRLPVAQFGPFENVTVAVHVQTVNTQAFWTITSTATCDPSLTRGVPFCRRVQATLEQENFAKYELFINNFGGVWSPGYLQGLGLGQVFMGPININSGVGFFPDFWSLSQVTCAATGGVDLYASYSNYSSAVYGNNAANNDVSIMQYWDSTYPTAPQFLGGLSMLPAPIALPSNMSTAPQTAQLVSNAGLTLPDAYPGYKSAAGPNFAITLSNPNNVPGYGQITVQQYLGTANGVPSYGPSLITNVAAVNGAMVVKGNVVSLQGVLNGRLTIGALAASSDPSGGNVNITGNLQYNSLNSSTFQYPNPANLVNANGTVNTSYVNTVQSQLNNVTDILGIVAEGNVMIPQTDLNGNPIAASPSQPIYIDAVVMATGASTSTPGGGGFGVTNDLTRPPGQGYFLGGMIQNEQLSWGLYNGSGITNGINETSMWDKRAAMAGGAPPFFPTTGYYDVLPGSWRSSYVAGASTPTTYPTINPP